MEISMLSNYKGTNIKIYKKTAVHERKVQNVNQH